MLKSVLLLLKALLLIWKGVMVGFSVFFGGSLKTYKSFGLALD